MADGDSLPICQTCGMQYGAPRPDCPICEDERQYVPATGQQWTDLATLRAREYTSRIEREGEGVIGIGSTPSFAIGQRALLVQADSGNVLWDCVDYLDEQMVTDINELGGIAAIAISHPHYYTTMVEWSRAFDAPIYLHAKDEQWIFRDDPAIHLWEGSTYQLAADVTLLNLGVHFAGGTVLSWPAGHAGKGALFTGDIVQVIPDREFVAFMYSYPNLIPERPSVVRQVGETLERYQYDAIYGAWWKAIVRTNGAEVLRRSVRRYLEYTAG